MIRPAELRDVPTLVRMGIKFHSDVNLSPFFSLNPDHLAKRLRQMLRSSNTRLVALELDSDVQGVAGFTINGSFFTDEAKVAQELFYWINPGYRGTYGKELLRALEATAVSEGCTHIAMIALETSDPERMDKIYRAVGYLPVERTYLKLL